MKLFSKKPFSNNIQVALDGTTFESYTPKQLTEGISLDNVDDFSKIAVKGSSADLSNLTVITSAFALRPTYQNIAFEYEFLSSNNINAEKDSKAKYIAGLNVSQYGFNSSELPYANRQHLLLVFKKNDTYYVGIDKKDDVSEYNIVLIYADDSFTLQNDVETYTEGDFEYVRNVRVIAESGFYEISDLGKCQE